MKAHERLIGEVQDRLQGRGWKNIEVEQLSERLAVVRAESEPETFLLNTRISIYVGPRSIRGGNIYGVLSSREIESGRFGWGAAVFAYGPTKEG